MTARRRSLASGLPRRCDGYSNTHVTDCVKALLLLRVAPNARRSEVVGPYGDAIKVKIHAPAVDGKANEALREFLADRLQISARDIEFVSGEKSRDKTLSVEGLDIATVRERLLAPA